MDQITERFTRKPTVVDISHNDLLSIIHGTELLTLDSSERENLKPL